MQTQLESERKASRAALANEQEGKKIVQVSWRSAVCSACLKLCVLQVMGSMAQHLWCCADALLSVFLLSTCIFLLSCRQAFKLLSKVPKGCQQPTPHLSRR
jgi:hypothetical protein